jgi:carnitine monooxygenase subunit
VCPYHGWSYNLDGTIRGIPGRDGFGDLDGCSLDLPKVQLDVWKGFIFVRVTGGGPSVNEMMLPFEADLANRRLEDLEPLDQPRVDHLDVNWKCVVDNDSEGYHVPKGHPGLNRLFEHYVDESFAGGVSRSIGRVRAEPRGHWSERGYQALLAHADHLPEAERRTWLYLGLFPSFSMGIYPDMAYCMQTVPASVDETMVIVHSYALPDSRREIKALRYLNERINAQVWREDIELARIMADGLRSSSYTDGPLSEQEICLRQFHNRIRELIPVAGRRESPVEGVCAANDALVAL